MFAYCENNPIITSDISGHVCCSVLDNDFCGGDNRSTSYRDITEELNAIMESHANELVNEYVRQVNFYNDCYCSPIGNTPVYNYSGISALGGILAFFREKETNQGDWDIKETTQFYKFDHFIYNGKVLSGEDLGNIHYGYVGASLFPDWLLYAGAGINQARRSFHIKYFLTWFDEPDDYEMISYGISLYREAHP